MKVVLLKDVKKLGKNHDIVDVSDGYANNYLIPRKMAIEATNQNISEATSKKGAINFKKQREREEAAIVKETIEKLVLEFRLKSYESGKLFGSITTKEISEELEKKINKKIDKRKIEVETIKQTGVYEAKVKLYESVIANLKIKVLGV